MKKLVLTFVICVTGILVCLSGSAPDGRSLDNDEEMYKFLTIDKPGILDIWRTDTLVYHSIPVTSTTIDSIQLLIPTIVKKTLVYADKEVGLSKYTVVKQFGIDFGVWFGVYDTKVNNLVLLSLSCPLDTITENDECISVVAELNGKYFREDMDKKSGISVIYCGFPMDCKERVDSCFRLVRFNSNGESRPLFKYESR